VQILLLASLFTSIIGLMIARYHGVFIFWAAMSFVNLIFVLSPPYDIGLYFGVFSFIFNILSIIPSFYFFIRFGMGPSVVDEPMQFSKVYIFGLVSGAGSLLFYILSVGGLSGLFRSWVEIAITRQGGDIIEANISQGLYFVSLTFLLASAKFNKIKSYFTMLVIVVLYVSFSRVKANALPFVIPLIYQFVNAYRQYPIKLLLSGIIGTGIFLLFYFLITAARWTGDLFSVESFLNSFNSAVKAGLERNLVSQTESVFLYFMENEAVFAQSYIYILNPLMSYFGVDLVNPIYSYFRIGGGVSDIMRGSAHPSIYGDSLANFSWFGLFVGFFYVVFLGWASRISILSGSLFSTGFLVATSYSVPMMIRGSVHYGLLYFIINSIFILFSFLIFYSMGKIKWK